MRFRRNLEMSLTREEFLRLLPAAVGAFDADGDTFRGGGGECPWRVRLVPLGERRLGSVAIPRYRVEIVLEARGEADGEAFMRHFHRAFLRGGG